MPLGCRIIKTFPRPTPDLVSRFRDIPVANLDDVMNRTAAVDAAIKPLRFQEQLLGIAFTIRLPPGDNLMLHAALDLAKPGDVMVIDAGGFPDRAIFGELMASYCQSRGIRGIVCDGAVRDWDALASMEHFPIYARSVTPNGPYKNGPGEINVPVVIGGQTVHPGDIVVGDRDGLLFVDPAFASQLADAAKEVCLQETAIRNHIQEDGTYLRPWLEEKLQKIGCEIL